MNYHVHKWTKVYSFLWTPPVEWEECFCGEMRGTRAIPTPSLETLNRLNKEVGRADHSERTVV